MQNLAQFVTGAPLWVWPLFAALIYLGIRASRPGWVSVWFYAGLQFTALFALSNVASLEAGSLGWLAFASAWAASAVWGTHRMASWVLSRDGNRVALKGEWVTMTACMVLFFTNYVRGVLDAVAPDLLAGGGAILIAAVLGLASGQFAGRAIYVFAPRRGLTS